MALTDLVPTSPGQGLAIVFNAAQLALGAVRGPKRIKLDSLQGGKPGLNYIEVDCTLSESYAYEADVTEFEVETGSNVSDHRRTKPAEFSISGIISDTPLDSNLVEAAVAAAAPALGLAVNAFGTAEKLLAGDATLTREGFRKLEELYQREATFRIETKFRSFENMVVKSLHIQRDSGTGLALPFTATFKEIRFVSTASTTISGPAMLQSPTHLGERGPKEAPDKFRIDALDTVKLVDDASGGTFKKTFPAPPPELLKAP
jgi:hypothetical protein